MTSQASLTSAMKDTLKAYGGLVEDCLAGCLAGKGIPEPLSSAMDYSLMAGGKRIRPVLCVIWAEMLGLPKERAVGFASALELIHTYSLVHDDLPAMDDDDLRRGKPSNHKVFGEAMAILAGDGLLTEAFSLMLASGLPAERVVRASAAIARAAGPSGMVGGQAVDMLLTGRDGVELAELQAMHAMKTGALLEVACVSGALIAGATDQDLARASDYGRSIGVAFQIADDILDVVGDEVVMGKPVGSDEAQGKNTYPRLVGLVRSRELAQGFADRAVEAIQFFDGPCASFLRELARYIVERAA